MKYIKKYNDKILEAPYILEKDGKKIYGYNKEANEKMLLKDGYLKYNGNLSTVFLDIIDGKIIEKQIPKPQQTIFSKLEIRRAARSIEKEDFLNTILSMNSEIQADWNDAQEIDLNDEMFSNLSGVVEIQEFIDEIKDVLQ